MKSIRQALLLLLGALVILAGYRFGVKPLEAWGFETYYQKIIRSRVESGSTLSDKPFSLGLYRPELPYQFSRLYEIQENLGAQISIVSYYQAWGEGEEYAFKTLVNRNLSKGGFTPLITWEPWVSAFPLYKNISVDSSLAIITSGAFDGYIREWARQAVRFGKPFFLRPGHEMSNPWYAWSLQHGNSPEAFKAFWRHVYRIFKDEGANNAVFVWNPYTPADTVFFPGADCVDWIGLDVFNFGTLSQDGYWMDFYTVTKLLYDAVKPYGKPVLVAEAGSAANGGSKRDWYRDLFHSIAAGNFPLIRGLVLFDTPQGVTPTGIPVDLGFSTDSTITGAIDGKELINQLHIIPYAKGDNP